MYYRLGILGQSISYSLSPAIFAWAFRRTGLDGEYAVFDLPVQAAEELIRSERWDGLSVTVPHKTLARELCSDLTTVARKTGAVNTLSRRQGRVWGDNTDVAGFRHALRRSVPRCEALRRVLVIGSGGAARAIIVALRECTEALEIAVASRLPEQARRRLHATSEFTCAVQVISLPEAAGALASFDLIVQATPVGSARNPGLPLPAPLRFAPHAHVFDLVYSPVATEFLRAAKECGAHSENGLVMLIAQAAASFETWTGVVFPLDEALTDLLPNLVGS